MNDALNIPTASSTTARTLTRRAGLCAGERVLERLPEIAKNAIADACTGSNPVSPARRDGKAAQVLLLRHRSGFLIPLTA